MIIIKLQGGLGNQMFQYALGRILADKTSSELFIDDVFFLEQEKKIGHTPRHFELSIFNIKFNIANDLVLNRFNNLSFISKLKRKLKLNYPKKIIEDSFYYSNELLQMKSPVYFEGYFQSYKYYIGYEEFVRKLFKFREGIHDTFNAEILRKIYSSNFSVSIHIRRGDYVHDKKANSFHGICSIDYYLESIDYISARLKEVTLFFFSDEIDWVKTQFKDLNYNKIFVESNKGSESWKDMFLMSQCKHNIIANSSFSWWAAWLNSDPDKIVIAPKQWFNDKSINTKDITPPEWIRM